MANRDGANGLRPSRHLSGGAIRANEYSIASAYAVSLFTGDTVTMTGTGKNIAVATGGTTVDNLGVFAGCRYVNAQGKQIFSQYWPASTVATDIVAFVYDDPNIIFVGQCDDLAAADIGALIDSDQPNDGSLGSATTGQSGTELVATTGTTGKTFRLLGLINSPDNAYGTFAKAEVLFVEHVMNPAAEDGSGTIVGAGGV